MLDLLIMKQVQITRIKDQYKPMDKEFQKLETIDWIEETKIFESTTEKH